MFCGEIYHETQEKKKKKVADKPMGKQAVINFIEKSKLKNDNKWKEWQTNDLYYHDGKNLYEFY